MRYGLVLCLALAALIVVRCSSNRPQQFASLNPETAYVGNASCEQCHKKIAESYRETGMGRSMYRPSRSEAIETFGPEALVYDRHLNLWYRPEWKGNDFYLTEFRLEGADTVHKRSEKVDYVVGSGNQTRSYLMERNQYLYEMPLTWYVAPAKWDFSPGYDAGHNSRFSREMGIECIVCHTGKVDFVAGSKNRYRHVSLGIDCEKCHGPGSEHVRLMEQEDIVDVGVETDYSIVNPAKLPVSAQFDVCQQCHLQGVNIFKPGKSITDFRPGMHLHDVYDVFLTQTRDTNAFGIASHAERLQQSQCFLKSNGKLTCTTCHDPHKRLQAAGKEAVSEQPEAKSGKQKAKSPVTLSRSPERGAAEGSAGPSTPLGGQRVVEGRQGDNANPYVKQCQSCHTPGKPGAMQGCAAPEHTRMSADNNCISCHMASGGTRDIPHVRFHDHKIRVLAAGGEDESGKPEAKSGKQKEESHKREAVMLSRSASAPVPKHDNYPVTLSSDDRSVVEGGQFLTLLCGTRRNPEAEVVAKAWLLYFETLDQDTAHLQRAAALPAADYDRARWLMYRGDNLGAMSLTERLLKQRPTDPLLLFLKGELAEQRGGFEEAHQAFLAAWHANPEGVDAGLKAATALLRARPGNAAALAQAKGMFETLLKQKPFDERLIANYGFVLLNERNFPSAESQFVQALRLNPDYALALQNLAALNRARGNEVAAKRYEERLKAISVAKK